MKIVPIKHRIGSLPLAALFLTPFWFNRPAGRNGRAFAGPMGRE